MLADCSSSRAMWRSVAENLKAQVQGDVAVTADRFWAIAERELAPAAARGDQVAAQAALARATEAFQAHRTAVDTLVEGAVASQAGIETEALSWSNQVMVGGAIGGLLILGALIFGTAFLMRRVFNPLSGMTAAMQRLADGHIDVMVVGEERKDEIGALARALLAMQGGDTDSETVNAVFRAVHSVKGGAGAFGMDALVRFAHVFETTLDAVRNGELAADAAVVAVLLKSADRLTDHITAAKQGAELHSDDADLVSELQAFTGAPVEDDEVDPGAGFVPQAIALGDFGPSPELAPAPLKVASSRWTVTFHPHSGLYRNGNEPLTLLRELERLGPIELTLDADVPGLDDFDPEGAYLTWTVQLEADVSETTVREVFEFVEGQCDLTVVRPDADVAMDEGPSLSDLLALARGDEEQAPDPASPAELSLDALLALARDEPASVTASVAPTMKVEAEPPVQQTTGPAQTSPTDAAPSQPRAPTERTDSPAQPTIRVDLDRVDRLIDLVGELVINQAMLAQQMHEAGLARTDALALSLDDLEHLTRDIQDSVMAIRAQPVKSVFQRMPRLVREVSAMTGKSARLATEG